MDTIRYDVCLCGLTVFDELFGYKKGRRVDMTHAAVGHAAEDTIDHRVDPSYFAQAEGRGDILRLYMESGRNRFAYSLTIRKGSIG